MARARPPFLQHLHFLDERLWASSPLRTRSSELTTLYVDRFRGPRLGTALWSHDHWELSCTVSGKGALVARDESPLTSNTTCLIPPRVRHDERASGDLDTIWIGFRGSRIPRLHVKGPQLVQSRGLAKFIEQIWVFAKQQGGPIGPELDSMTTTATAWFFRILAEGTSNADTAVIDPAVRYFEQHFAEPVYIADLAARLGCSAGHFHRLFKQHTGRSPILYLAELRVRRAAHLLSNTQLPIAEIARMVGFEDQFYFSRVFHRMMGRTASEYRRR
jgi:AraC-like DNA-binding protein